MACPCGTEIPRYLNPAPAGFETWCIACDRRSFVLNEVGLAVASGMSLERAQAAFERNDP